MFASKKVLAVFLLGLTAAAAIHNVSCVLCGDCTGGPPTDPESFGRNKNKIKAPEFSLEKFVYYCVDKDSCLKGFASNHEDSFNLHLGWIEKTDLHALKAELEKKGKWSSYANEIKAALEKIDPTKHLYWQFVTRYGQRRNGPL